MDGSALNFLAEFGRIVGKARFLVHQVVMNGKNNKTVLISKRVYDLLQIDMKPEGMIDIVSNIVIAKLTLDGFATPAGEDTVIAGRIEELRAVLSGLVNVSVEPVSSGAQDC